MSLCDLPVPYGSLAVQKAANATLFHFEFYRIIYILSLNRDC